LTQRIILKSQAGLEITLKGSTFWFKCIDTKKKKNDKKKVFDQKIFHLFKINALFTFVDTDINNVPFNINGNCT
jgi:hypothetical protein